MSIKANKIYIAGPLYNEGERWLLEILDKLCRDIGYDTYLPHRDAGICEPTGEDNNYFFEMDKNMLDQVDAVLAVLNGTDIDSGTSWEIGYAYAKNVFIIGYINDTRINIPKANINLMIYNSVKLCDNINSLKSVLINFKIKNNE